jgi:hypothetical protein
MSVPAGKYKGRTCIRAGREGELTKPEFNKIKKGIDLIDLELRADETFVFKKATAGRFRVDGLTVYFTVESFGGQTLQQMRDKAAEMERTFGLAFLFDPFELVVEGDKLVTPATGSPIYIEYELEGGSKATG